MIRQTNKIEREKKKEKTTKILFKAGGKLQMMNKI